MKRRYITALNLAPIRINIRFQSETDTCERAKTIRLRKFYFKTTNSAVLLKLQSTPSSLFAQGRTETQNIVGVRVDFQSPLHSLGIYFHFCFEFVEKLHFGRMVHEVFESATRRHYAFRS